MATDSTLPGGSVRRLASFTKALVATNLKASLALRAAFWLQASFMLVNNLAYFVTWLIFFNRFHEVRGWQLEDLVILFGIVAGGFGIGAVFAGGAAQLARTISDGDLDPLLVQPKPPLLQIVASRSTASGWGDLATGMLFLVIASLHRPLALPLGLLAVAASATVSIATAIVLQSTAFWLGRVEVLARQFAELQVTFALYPGSLFSGLLRVLLFTAIPAGFVGYLPADLVRSPDLRTAAAILAGGAIFVALAAWTFSRGLRIYESGSRFGGIW